MPFIAWPEIESFHHIRKFLRVDPGEWWMAKEKMHGSSVVTYRAKVKLHGTNAAVQILPDGTVLAQSRTGIITPENDNAGFARWVKANEEAWRETAKLETLAGEIRYVGFIFYGEWIGPGIQKGVAVSEIPRKSFAVFAMRVLGKDGTGDDTLMIEPRHLEMYIKGLDGKHNIPDTYILPWYTDTCHHGCDTRVTKELNVDWKHTDEQLTQTIAPINDWVAAIEANDPWVEETFGVKGTGEGLVFYPVSKPHLGFESFQNLCFKAKGEKHKNIKTAAPAQVNPETAASVDAFVELVLTPARLEQGATAVGGFDLKFTGKFVQWITGDIQKECGDEMAASNLEWKQIQKPLADKARTWYIAEAKIR